MIHRIAEGPRDDDGMEAGELVRGEIVVGHPALGVEVFPIGTGIERADRDHEAQPIRRRHFAPTPGLRQGNGRLGIDEAGIGPGEGLGADIVLLDPTEPPPRQGGTIGTDDGFETDITGFRQQDRTETHGQVRHPRGAFTDMGKFMGKPRARMDFQEELGQIDAWQTAPGPAHAR